MWSFRHSFSVRAAQNRSGVQLQLESLNERCAPSSIASDNAFISPSVPDKTPSSHLVFSTYPTPSKQTGSVTANIVESFPVIQLDLDAAAANTNNNSPIVLFPPRATTKTISSVQSGTPSVEPSLGKSSLKVSDVSPGNSQAASSGTTTDSSLTHSTAAVGSGNSNGSKAVSAGKTGSSPTKPGGTATTSGPGLNHLTPVVKNTVSHATTKASKVVIQANDAPSAGTSDSDGGSVAGPKITKFGAAEKSEGMFEFTGTVLDSQPGGLTIEFGGLPSLEGKTTTTEADGTFDCCFILKTDGTDDGIASAVTTDAQCLESNTAYYSIIAS